MKYLKRYKLFEAVKSIEDLVQEAKDICLELNDDNIKTECYYNHPFVSDGKLQIGFITIGMERSEIECLEWHEVEEVVDRLIDYFELNSWILSTVRMDGDDLINPKQWVENLRKKVNYTFTGLTINFVQE